MTSYSSFSMICSYIADQPQMEYRW